MIMRVSEHLKVELPLGVVGVFREPAFWVCFRHRFKSKGSIAVIKYVNNGNV